MIRILQVSVQSVVAGVQWLKPTLLSGLNSSQIADNTA